ncbi:aldo/keto reductase family oxidoreductase [Brucella pituitosa]|uniref:aldo/keto reductase family oxidoreductase n=1 Tax=Brucella pituitosa TaxID=571256 RepID=UPI0009A1E1F9|nr:aldo/keto reductase family oxidoreductase [Brucella pituitosa]
MPDTPITATYALGGNPVSRMGYGAMQLAGKGAFGPPRDRAEAIAVLREAVESGVNHIDTSDFYGPHVTNQIIRDALHPYADQLVIVTKVGASRGADASFNPAFSRADLIQAVHDNLRNLGRDVLDVVNLRAMFDTHRPAEGALEEPLSVLADLKRQGLIRNIGLSNVTARQIQASRTVTEIACVQNHYNLVHRADDSLIDHLAAAQIPYVPFFPLGGFSPIQSSALTAVAQRLAATPMQVALSWLLRRAPNILLIPGTASRLHLRENLAAQTIELPQDALSELNALSVQPASAARS